jgi:uncharacterized membrane protein
LLAFALTLSLVAAPNSFARDKANQRARPLGYNFRFIKVPGFAESWGGAINNAGSSLIHVFGGPAGSTYLRHANGRLERIAYPGGAPSVGLGLNNRGDVVGDVTFPEITYYIGFVRNRTGTFTPFTVPGLGDPLSGMQANSINDRGQVVGGYAIGGEGAAFIRQRDGTLESFQYGGGGIAFGINNRGQISGQSAAGGSFIRERDGSFTVVAFPGASDTQAFGINNRGQVAGLYYSDITHGYVRYEDGTFQTVDAPGADVTWLWGINDIGTITGTAYFSGQQQAFIGTPRWR